MKMTRFLELTLYDIKTKEHDVNKVSEKMRE